MPKFYEPEQLKHLQKLEMEILTDFKGSVMRII